MKITVIGEETPDLVEELDRCRPTLEGRSPILAIADRIEEDDEQDEERLFEVTLNRTGYFCQHATMTVWAYDDDSAAEQALSVVNESRNDLDWTTDAEPYDSSDDYDVENIEETD